MKKANSFLSTLFIGFVIGTFLYIASVVYQYIVGAEVAFNNKMVINYGYYLLYSIALTFVNTYFFKFTNHKIDWKGKYTNQILTGFLGSIFLSTLTLLGLRILQRVFFGRVSFETFFTTESFQFYFISLLITIFISFTFHSIYYYKIVQERKVKQQKVIAGTASAQFESLKNQIDPHFLFNSLNVLTSLIEEQPEIAQKFTTSLSKIYRYVLEQKDKDLVSVVEELAFAKTYMDLLKIRFENSVFYQLPETLNNPDAKVVPLSLQLLLENAIKHNIASETKPLHIHIYEENNSLVVENNLQKKEIIQSRKGVGLQNIVDRYHIVTNRKISIEETNNKFRVKIPELTKQFTVMETQQDNSMNNSYYKAQKRVQEMKDFYGNLISYCVVIPFLIFINYYTYWEFKWFWFPMFGWGIGVAIHGFTVFGYGTNWEERKIREFMEKEKQNNKNWS